jgi:nucleotide-binding universal stress UspA family protein
MPGPVVVGVALNERDGPVMALGALLARLSDRPLALVHAYPYDPLSVPLPEYETSLRDDALRRLGGLADTVRGGLDVTVHAYARLSAAYGLHDMAELLGGAAIVVGSSHRGPVGRVLLGTIATRLLHGSPCPVAVAPAGYEGPPPPPLRIGVAFDGKAESRAARARLRVRVHGRRAAGRGEPAGRRRVDRPRRLRSGPAPRRRGTASGCARAHTGRDPRQV